MSSMGDVLHTLPALTDAKEAIPNLQVDWVVEPAFVEIPSWHASVAHTIALPLRKWRKNIIQTFKTNAFQTFKKQIQSNEYDAVIDAQGLLKSAWITKVAHGESHGLDKKSARETISSYFYKNKYHINKNQHAIKRTRMLFSKALKYTLPTTPVSYGIDPSKLPKLPFETPKQYFIFIHGTTWQTKQYPTHYWNALLGKAKDAGITVYLPWGNETERQRANELSKQHGIVLPKLSIAELATLLHRATAAVSIDTGLGHLSAALNTQTISLYGPTNPARVGTKGLHAINLTADFPCAPCVSKNCHYAEKHKSIIEPACYTTLEPNKVWQALTELCAQRN